MKDLLVVVSKTKQYVRKSADLQTSAEVIDVLSQHLENILNKSAELAKKDKRKTLMARDVERSLGL